MPYIFKSCILSLTVILLGCRNHSEIRQDYQKYQFEYAKPEAMGWSSSKLDTLTNFLEEAGSSAMMMMVDGKVILEWGDVTKPHTIHSIRKSMLNSLYGIKINDGVIDTSMTISDLGIDDLKPLSENEKSARIADLLRSRSGIYHPAAATSDGMLRGKPDRNTYKPGEYYYYNNWDFNVLGFILEKETNESIYELYLKEIAIPLGMHDYTGTYETIDGESEEIFVPTKSGFYQYEKSKSKYPAYHFRLSARDMAIYGQLWLNEGKWNGEQILPTSWIETSTKPYSIYNPGYGIAYGMLWNVLIETESRSSKSFFHTGTGIHMLGIYPESKLVLVHRVDTESEYTFNENDFYRMIDLVWNSKVE